MKISLHWGRTVEYELRALLLNCLEIYSLKFLGSTSLTTLYLVVAVQFILQFSQFFFLLRVRSFFFDMKCVVRLASRFWFGTVNGWIILPVKYFLRVIFEFFNTNKCVFWGFAYVHDCIILILWQSSNLVSIDDSNLSFWRYLRAFSTFEYSQRFLLWFYIRDKLINCHWILSTIQTSHLRNHRVSQKYVVVTRFHGLREIDLITWRLWRALLALIKVLS